ncbi:MAG: hypothetical protein K2L34_01850 [Muribaculaceae bacterium]|nr:hypothetical protein [Muribaculaceae bacterium]MDE6335290.1 hypothetical protein [Muribaculaceae bacterium]
MDSKENKQENGSVNSDLIADSLRVDARNRRRDNTAKNNRLWLWLGILVLVAILLYALFSMGLFESMSSASGN